MKQHFGKYLGPTLIDEGEPLTAWRTWQLHGGHADVRLVGTWAAKFEWRPRGVTVAECLAEDGKRCNLSMSEKCNCGLWGAAALTNLLEHGAVGLFPRGVLGRAHLWGFVHVYEFGFRASMGRPLDLWLGNSTAVRWVESLHQTYGVPVALGLPTEIVADPALLSGVRVREATRVYQSRPVQMTPAARPTVQRPTKRMVHHCSGCGAPGRIDRCPNCRARPATLLSSAVLLR